MEGALLHCGRLMISSCCQGRPRRLQALFGNLSRLFRLNVAPDCSASLVLGVRPRLEMKSLFWIYPPCRSDTRLTRHLLQPPSPALETLFPSSRSVQNLAFRGVDLFPRLVQIAITLRFSSSSPLANPRSLLLRLSLLSSGARWVRFSIKPNLSHSFFTRPQLGVVDGLRNKPATLRIMKNCSSLV